MRLRNIFILVLTLCMVLTFFACSGKADDENGNTDRKNESNELTDNSSGDLHEHLVAKEYITYNADDSVYQSVKVELNSAGLPAVVTIEGRGQGTITYNYNDQNTLTILDYQETNGDRRVYEFNKCGEVIKKDEYSDGALVSTTEYQYDEALRITGKYYKDLNNAKANKEITYDYKLDDQGRVIEELEYVNGKEYFLKEYEYDDRGNEINYSGTYIGSEPYIRVSEYDEAGRLKKSTEYTGDVEDAYTEYSYDDNGNLLKSITMKNGVEEAFEEYLYDEQGNVIKFTYFERTMGIRHYEYEYDQNNAKSKDRYFVKGELERYTDYTWHDQTLKLDKNIASALERVLSILESK